MLVEVLVGDGESGINTTCFNENTWANGFTEVDVLIVGVKSPTQIIPRRKPWFAEAQGLVRGLIDGSQLRGYPFSSPDRNILRIL